MTDKARAYSQMFLGVDRAKSGSDKTVYWRQDDGQHRQTATEVRERAHQARQDDPGDAWRQISAGSIAAFGALTWDKDPDAAPLPREDPRLGEIIGWRAWRVQPDHVHAGHSWLMSLVRPKLWHPGKPMTGEPSDDGRDGVNAFKTRRDLMTSSVVAFSMVGGAYVIGQVALWGDVVEHELGWRAQFGAVHSLDFMLGIGDAEGDELLADLRRRYNMEGG